MGKLSKTAVPTRDRQAMSTEPESSSLTRINNSHATTGETGTGMKNLYKAAGPHRSTVAATDDKLGTSARLAEAESNDAYNFLLERQKAVKITDRLVLDNDELSKGILKAKYAIPVRYPYQNEIVRTHLGITCVTNPCFTLLDPQTEEVYLVPLVIVRRAGSDFFDNFVPIDFALTVSSKGDSFLWPYHRTGGIEPTAGWAVEEANKGWVRVNNDMEMLNYRAVPQPETFAKPRWPRLDSGEVFCIAFRHREIRSFDHPLMKRLWKRAAA